MRDKEINYYKLKSVIVHIGDSNGGHYISYVTVDNRWYEINDDQI